MTGRLRDRLGNRLSGSSSGTLSWKLVVAALLVAGLPFALLGEAFEADLSDWLRQPRPAGAVAVAAVAALAVDIALPVPSSVVVGYAAMQLGPVAAVLLGTLGLTLTCEAGYWATRLVGTLASEAPGSEAPVSEADGPTASASDPPPRLPLFLAATRAVPLLAEAAVVIAAGCGMPHRRFLAVVAASNALVCSLYAALGVWGQTAGRETLAMVIAVALPVALSAVAAAAGWHRPEPRAM